MSHLLSGPFLHLTGPPAPVQLGRPRLWESPSAHLLSLQSSALIQRGKVTHRSNIAKVNWGQPWNIRCWFSREETKAGRWGQMWFAEEMGQPPLNRRAARRVSLSRSLVEGDMEIIG